MTLLQRALIPAGIALALAGCSGNPVRHAGSGPVSSHGYYLDDGPGANPPADLAAIPDAVPRYEPPIAAANRPYRAMGKEYVPVADAGDYHKRGLASWYGRRYNGKPTSSGEPYDMYAMTAASPTLPIPSYARVTNLGNGRSVVVRINDRGPFHKGRIIDLSYTAAWKLGVLRKVTEVEVDGIGPGSATAESGRARPIADPEPGAYLQLGAFYTSDGANRVVRLVRERIGFGLPDIRRYRVGDMIKVQMGPFASPSKLDRVARQVEREIGIHAFRVLR